MQNASLVYVQVQFMDQRGDCGFSDSNTFEPHHSPKKKKKPLKIQNTNCFPLYDTEYKEHQVYPITTTTRILLHPLGIQNTTPPWKSH